MARVAIPGIIFITILVVIAAFVSMRRIGGRLNQMIQSLLGIPTNQQDLTQRISLGGNDEFSRMAEDFDRFISGYHELVIDLKRSNELLSRIDDSLKQSSSGNLVQSDMLKAHAESAATAMNQLSVSTAEIANNIAKVSQNVSATNTEGCELHKKISEETLQAKRLSDSIESGTRQVKELSNQVNEMFSILDVIQGIADQTNLLALHAAIEADRAGEQGRGFAVVADEVRSLATRTRDSTEEIQQMPQTLREGSEASVQTMDVGQEKATVVSESISQLGDRLGGLFQHFNQISDMNIQIAAAGEEQSVVINDLNHTVAGVSEGAGKVRDSAHSNEVMRREMGEQVVKINQLVGGFTT